MILPLTMKIGPVGVEMAGTSNESNYISTVDIEYMGRCWSELKPLVDNLLEMELKKSNSNRTQRAKTKLAIEVLNLLGKHAVEEKRLKNELIKTGKFSREEAEVFLKDAVSQRIIHEGETGFYSTN
jgi:hypothetical protein